MKRDDRRLIVVNPATFNMQVAQFKNLLALKQLNAETEVTLEQKRFRAWIRIRSIARECLLWLAMGLSFFGFGSSKSAPLPQPVESQMPEGNSPAGQRNDFTWNPINPLTRIVQPIFDAIWQEGGVHIDVITDALAKLDEIERSGAEEVDPGEMSELREMLHALASD